MYPGSGATCDTQELKLAQERAAAAAAAAKAAAADKAAAAAANGAVKPEVKEEAVHAVAPPGSSSDEQAPHLVSLLLQPQDGMNQNLQLSKHVWSALSAFGKPWCPERDRSGNSMLLTVWQAG